MDTREEGRHWSITPEVTSRAATGELWHDALLEERVEYHLGRRVEPCLCHIPQSATWMSADLLNAGQGDIYQGT